VGTNDQNLISEAHKLTLEDRKKGGRSKSIAKRLRDRKYCSSNCPLWDGCFLKSIAHQKEQRVNGKAICLLKTSTLRSQDRVNRVLKEGKAGLVLELQENLLRLSHEVDLHPEIDTIKDYLKEIREAIGIIHGTKSQIEANVSGGLTYDSFITALKGGKNDKDTKSSTDTDKPAQN